MPSVMLIDENELTRAWRTGEQELVASYAKGPQQLACTCPPPRINGRAIIHGHDPECPQHGQQILQET